MEEILALTTTMISPNSAEVSLLQFRHWVDIEVVWTSNIAAYGISVRLHMYRAEVKFMADSRCPENAVRSGRNELLTFVLVFLHNRQTNLQDLILLRSFLDILVQLLQSQLVALAARGYFSTTGNTRELEIEGDEMRVSNMLNDTQYLLWELALLNVHDCVD